MKKNINKLISILIFIFCLNTVLFLSSCGQNAATENEEAIEKEIQIPSIDWPFEVEENYVVRANGNIIGQVKNPFWPGPIYNFEFINQDFQKTSLNKDGTIKSYYIYYKELDCQGEMFAYFTDDNQKSFMFSDNKGILCDYQSVLYYSLPNYQLYKLESKSYYNFYQNNCKNYNKIGIFFKLTINDPKITGIEIYPFPLPITIDGITEKSVFDLIN